MDESANIFKTCQKVSLNRDCCKIKLPNFETIIIDDIFENILRSSTTTRYGYTFS